MFNTIKKVLFKGKRMLKINKDVEYALMSLIEMNTERRTFSARELSHRFHIPFDLLSKILQRLAQKDVIVSIQGPKGGYVLKRSISDITMEEVVRAVHGKIDMAPCLDKNGNCDQMENCNIRERIEQMQALFVNFLHSLTLKKFTDMDMRSEEQQQLFPMGL